MTDPVVGDLHMYREFVMKIFMELESHYVDVQAHCLVLVPRQEVVQPCNCNMFVWGTKTSTHVITMAFQALGESD